MKKFTMKDESFVCENCGKIVEKLNYTARDHCPYCLYSKHLDINPGDRLNDCLGLLKPIDIEKFKNTYKIIYKCEKCGKYTRRCLSLSFTNDGRRKKCDFIEQKYINFFIIKYLK